MKSTDIVDNPNMRTDIPVFGPGDEVKVHVKVVEGNKERVQVFQGNVISITGGGIQEAFTVRKLSFGIALALGVVAGSMLWALASRKFRWEGFRDIADLTRHPTRAIAALRCASAGRDFDGTVFPSRSTTPVALLMAA